MQTFRSFFVIFSHFLSFSFLFVPFPFFLCSLCPLSGMSFRLFAPSISRRSHRRPFPGIWCRLFLLAAYLPSDSPLLSLCLLRLNLIRTSHLKHRPIFDASNADVAPLLSIYAGFFLLFTCGAIPFGCLWETFLMTTWRHYLMTKIHIFLLNYLHKSIFCCTFAAAKVFAIHIRRKWAPKKA